MNTGTLNSAWFVNPGGYADHQNGYERSYLACHGYGERYVKCEFIRHASLCPW